MINITSLLELVRNGNSTKRVKVIMDYLDKIEHQNVLMKKDFIDKNWIDNSVSARRFKRKVLDSTTTDKPLFIIGDSGYGKTYLAKIIQCLRGYNMSNERFIDVSNIANLFELKSLIHKKLFKDKIRTQDTVIIKNIDSLNDYLSNVFFEKIQSIINNENKVIFLLNDNNYIKYIAPFLSGNYEKIEIENRMSLYQNKINFIDFFISETTCAYSITLSEKVKHHIALNNSIQTVAHLKIFIKELYKQYFSENTITIKMVDELLLQQPWIKSQSLSESLCMYERELIYNALLESDWDQKIAAQKLKIPRRTLNYKYKKYRLGVQHDS